MTWLQRLSIWTNTPDAVRWLRTYPPYEAPYPARPAQLSHAQANLQYLLHHREQRLAVLSGLLADFHLDVRRGMSAADPAPLLHDLHEWTKQAFPKIYDPRLAHREVWLASTRQGPQIVFSLLMDLAILLGELVVERRKQYVWALDLDPDNAADGMISSMRPVVQIPKREPFPAPIILDFESLVFDHYLNVPSVMFGRINDLARPVLDALSGAYERPWVQGAPAR